MNQVQHNDRKKNVATKREHISSMYVACMYNVINVLKHMPQRNGNGKSYI